MAARAGLVEGPDPHRLPQHHLLRERRVRGRARGAHVLRPRRAEADAARGGAPRRHPGGPEPLRPGRAPAAASARRAVVLRLMLQQGIITPAEYRRGVARADAEAAERAPLGRHGPGAILRRVRQAAADRPARCEARLRRRLPRRHDDRPRAAEARARRRSTSGCRAPTARRRRSSRSTRRTARCSRCTAAAASTRASSTSRCRASASRARRSSRSCSRRR